MHNIIVGSGPAAAAAVLALAEDPTQQITVVDLGEQLDDPTTAALARMRDLAPDQWADTDRQMVTMQPAPVAGSALPEKRAYGSNHMFIDRGQQQGLLVPEGANSAAVSAAFGGFSTVWGAQIMPFSRSTFERWPVSWNEIEPHYRAVLKEVPLAAEEDDYAVDFPILGPRSSLPPVTGRTSDALSRYQKHRNTLKSKGIVVGKARLAFTASRCVRCGMCMTGCPYALIYSASQTIAPLVASGRITHVRKALVTRVHESIAGKAAVDGIDVRTGNPLQINGDRIFVAAGGLGSTRIALNSLSAPPSSVDLQESVQFLIPFVSRRTAGDPRRVPAFTLNQFNLLLKFDDECYTTSQIHCYPYNPAIAAALPGWLPESLTAAVLGRLTIGLGYLPSWRSPRLTVELRAQRADALPDIALRVVSDERPPLLRSVLRRLSAIGPKLDLHPVLPMVRMSGPGKSYHFGSTFPHGVGSDRLGRIGGFEHIHLIDGSVLPSVPSTTFTLTVMANAHRIATEALHV